MTLAHLFLMDWRSSHLLAQSRDVSRCFNYSLAAVMVVVEFGAEGFEHGHKGGDWGRTVSYLVVAARVLDPCHCRLNYSM